MLALTYPDGARVQRCDYLPENATTSAPAIVERIDSTSGLGDERNSRKKQAARTRPRLRRGNATGCRNDRTIVNATSVKDDDYCRGTPRQSSTLPLRDACGNGDGTRSEKGTGDRDFGFQASSQSCKTDDEPSQRLSIFDVEDEGASSTPKTRRRELPGRESWPGGSHPKDRCFLHLALILVLIVIGSNRHCGPFRSRANRAAFGVFAFGTAAVGQTLCAPVDVINDTAVRSERSANLSHITGTSRKIQMYIKHRHLQILPDGTVNGSNDDTSDFTVLQRTSVSRGQLRIQGVATCLYLCMDSCGLLYGSRDYTEDCVFNETLEQHNYNTYSSAHWSTPRKTLYLGLSGRGQPRRVQAKGHNLGRLSAYARVLTQVVAQDRVEALHRRMMGARHNVRHHHGNQQQTICPAPVPQEKDGRDKFRCRKRKKRKKRRRKCRAGEIPGPQCDPRANGAAAEAQSKRSCEGAALDAACRREAFDAPAKKRKSRIDEGDDVSDDLREEDAVLGSKEGKLRRSDDQSRGGPRRTRKGKKTPADNQAGKKRKVNGGGKGETRNVPKSLKRRSGNHVAGRFARTTYRLSSSPAATSPVSLSSEPTGPTIVEKSSTTPTASGLSFSSAASSSSVTAVSLAATGLASTLTLAVAGGDIFSEDPASGTGGARPGGGVLDLEELPELKDFGENYEDGPDEEEEDERDEGRKKFADIHGIKRTEEEASRTLAM